MGIFDLKMTNYKTAGKIDIEELHKHYQEVLGSKYKVKLEKKGKNAIASALKGVAADRIFVAKNAYHRTFVTPLHTENETHFRLEEHTVSPWLTLLTRRSGFIGLGIVRLIYGNGKQFYEDVVNVLRSKLHVEEEEQNVGLSRLWKKD